LIGIGIERAVVATVADSVRVAVRVRAGDVGAEIERAAGIDSLRLGAMMGDKLEPGRYSINEGAPVEARGGMIDVALSTDTAEIVLLKVK
jgi:hypothetical protein